MSRTRIYIAEPGSPADRPITHTDGDHYLDEIEGFNKDGTPFDFTAMTFHMQIGEERGFEEEDALFEITDDDFEITANQRGSDAGVQNILKIDIEDDFFSENMCGYYYIRLFDTSEKRFTIYGSEFIIDH